MIRKEWNKDLQQWVTWDDEKDVHKITPEVGRNMIKSGIYGREEQYKYFSSHPDEIEDQKLFGELKEEFGNDSEEKN